MLLPGGGEVEEGGGRGGGQVGGPRPGLHRGHCGGQPGGALPGGGAARAPPPPPTPHRLPGHLLLLLLPGMVGLAILANGLGWAGLASFWANRAGLGWAGPGWRPVTKNQAARFSLVPS